MAKSIYLVWQTDQWLSNNSKVLAYIGEDYEDCVAQVASECHLNSDDEEELLVNAQVRRPNKDGFFIEEQRLNHFHDQF